MDCRGCGTEREASSLSSLASIDTAPYTYGSLCVRIVIYWPHLIARELIGWLAKQGAGVHAVYWAPNVGL
jgi:hypothetical protein